MQLVLFKFTKVNVLVRLPVCIYESVYACVKVTIRMELSPSTDFMHYKGIDKSMLISQ